MKHTLVYVRLKNKGLLLKPAYLDGVALNRPHWMIEEELHNRNLAARIKGLGHPMKLTDAIALALRGRQWLAYVK